MVRLFILTPHRSFSCSGSIGLLAEPDNTDLGLHIRFRFAVLTLTLVDHASADTDLRNVPTRIVS